MPVSASAFPAGLIHIVCPRGHANISEFPPGVNRCLVHHVLVQGRSAHLFRVGYRSCGAFASLDWTYKRRAADEFVQRLASDQDRNRDVLIRLMVDVAAVEDFPKLRGIEDEAAKIAEAKAANATLRKYIKPYEQELVEQERAHERIVDAQTDAQEKRAFEASLLQLKGRYEELVVMGDPQARGLALEALLRDLFVLDGRVDLQRLLERKYRHASQTGEILLEASDF